MDLVQIAVLANMHSPLDSAGTELAQLGDVQYRCVTVYHDVDWKSSHQNTSSNSDSNTAIKLDPTAAVAAQNGGPLAVLAQESGKFLLHFWSAAAQHQGSAPWAGPAAGGNLIAMGWTNTHSELFVTVRQQGEVQLRTLNGTLLQTQQLLSSPPTLAADGAMVLITHALIWADGVVAVTSDMQVLAIEGLHGYADTADESSAAAVRFISLGRAALQRQKPKPEVTALAVIPPDCSTSG